MADTIGQRGRRLGRRDPTTRMIIGIGFGCSLLLGSWAFAAWTGAVGSFADDSYLWWTLAGFLLPGAASLAIVRLTRGRPNLAPAVGAAVLMIAVAFLAELLG